MHWHAGMFHTSQGTGNRPFFMCLFFRQSLRGLFLGLFWPAMTKMPVHQPNSIQFRCIHSVRITRKSNVSSFIHLLLKVDTISLRQIAHESDVTEESGKMCLKF